MKEVSEHKLLNAIDVMNRLSLNLPGYLYSNLCTKVPAPSYLGMISRWDKLIHSATYVVSDQTAQRVETLLGPHARACFTAWAIQQYDEPEGES